MATPEVETSKESAIEQVKLASVEASNDVRIRRAALEILEVAYEYQFETTDRREPRKKIGLLIEKALEKPSDLESE